MKKATFRVRRALALVGALALSFAGPRALRIAVVGAPTLNPWLLSNLRALYAEASPVDKVNGLTWYADGHAVGAALGARYGFSTEQALGVVAALSPGYGWGRNVQGAESFIRAFSGGARGRHLPAVGVYGGPNLRKAEEILAGADPSYVLGGPKVLAFFGNLVDPSDPGPVTIDRHAKSALFDESSPETSVVSRAEYQHLADHYRAVAGELSLLPNQLQAIIWVTWRRLKGIVDDVDVVDGADGALPANLYGLDGTVYSSAGYPFISPVDGAAS